MRKMWHRGMFLPSLYKEYSESETKSIRQYLNLLRLWDSAKENINEYWFGTPTWKFKVSWIFPKPLARIFGAPNYTTPSWKMSRVCGDNGLCLKSFPRVNSGNVVYDFVWDDTDTE